VFVRIFFWGGGQSTIFWAATAEVPVATCLAGL